MTPEEQLESVKELEERVERLRALYEQYFLGFEKIEPGVQRKDVDRRLSVLRREQIRNTGVRFKLNQITARYNTYATHWQRVVREIENGTYKRDLIRAAKRFGAEALTTAAKKRFKHLKLDEQAAAPPERSTAPSERSDVDLDVDFHDDDDDGFLAPMAPAAARALPPPPPSGRSSGPISESRPSAPPPSSRNPSSDPAPGSLRPLAPARPASIPAGEYAPTPRPLPTVPTTPARAPVAAASLDDDDELFAGLDLEHAAKLPNLGERAPSLRPAARTQPVVPAPPPVRPAARTLDVTRSVETPKITTQPEPVAARPAPPAAARPAPVAAARPAPATPATPTPPVAARPVATPAAAAAPANATALSDGRLREIYGQFVETKRKCQESTAAVTFDGLARNLRESAAKLAEKHSGKKIDFEVVVKDGKTVLKPVVR